MTIEKVIISESTKPVTVSEETTSVVITQNNVDVEISNDSTSVAVTPQNVLTVEIDRGQRGLTGPQGEKGDKGPPGPSEESDPVWNAEKVNYLRSDTAAATYIPLSQKGAASGVAPLDADSKIPVGYFPAIAITDTFVVASEGAMLALTAETGDIAVRTDLSKSFILQGSDPSNLSDWLELLVSTAGGSWGSITGTVSDQADLVSYLSENYAKIDASNQYFTNNIGVRASNPKLVAESTATDSPKVWIEKLSTFDGARLVSQGRRFAPANAASFVGAAGTMANPPSLGDFFVSMWYWSDNYNYQSVFSNATQTINFRGQAVSPPYIRVSGYGGSQYDFVAAAGQPMLAGRWTHLVFGRSGAAWYFWFDGVASPQNGSNCGANTISSWTLPLTTNGDVDEAIVYNIAPNQTLVNALYNGGSPSRITSYTNVVAHWSGDQSSGTTLTDNSGNGRNITGITGLTWITGRVSSSVLEALTDVPLTKIVNNGVNNSYGDLTYGYYTGSYGTSNYYDGLSHNFRVLGSSKMTMTSSGVNISQYTGSLTAGTLTSTGAVSSGTSIISGTFMQSGSSVQAATAVYTGAGLVGTPALAPSSDTNTGRFYPAADTIAEATGGVEATRITNNIISLWARGSGAGGVRIGRHIDLGSPYLPAADVRLDVAAVSLGGWYPTVGLNMHWNGSGWITSATGFASLWYKNPATGDFLHYNTASSNAANTNLTSGGLLNLRYRVTAAGMFAIGSQVPTALLDINSDILRLRIAKTPASAAATGNQGDIAWDADYIYVATAANTWKRAALTTW